MPRLWQAWGNLGSNFNAFLYESIASAICPLALKADPKLLSSLEKIQNPYKELELEIEVLGVYAYPNRWLEIDEDGDNREKFSAKVSF